MPENRVYHLMALLAVTIWGATFISTKILLNNGLSPADIMFYRFLIAYVLIWFFTSKKLFADSIKDELMLLASGICGGSLYFISENMALTITLASNVSLLICIAPLFTAILLHITIKGERFKRGIIIGSLVALSGVAMVVFNGNFILKINPLGDALTLVAALIWAFYTIIIRKLTNRYDTLFLTRKVFFYGLVTLCPIFIFKPLSTSPDILLRPIVLCNMLFLGVLASFLCFIIWNIAIKHLGGIRTSNYIYLNPLVTIIAAHFILNETITYIALIGAILILTGVYLSEKRKL